MREQKPSTTAMSIATRRQARLRRCPIALGLAVATGCSVLSCSVLSELELQLGHSSGDSSEEQPVLSLAAGALGGEGYADRPGAQARLGRIDDVAVGPDGSILFIDVKNGGSLNSYDLFTLRQLAPDGTLSTLAGSRSGFDDVQCDGAGSAAGMAGMQSLTLDTEGNVYVAQPGISFSAGGAVVRRVTRDGEVRTLLGTVPLCAGEPRAGLWGPSPSAWAEAPVQLRSTPAGEVFAHHEVIDSGSVTHAAVTQLLPGGGLRTVVEGEPSPSYARTSASFAVDAAGTVFISDFEQHVIFAVAPDGTRSVLAGAVGQAGHVDGPSAVARFNRPTFMALDPAGDIYVADSDSIRRIAAGAVSTVPGTEGRSGLLALDATGRLIVARSPEGVGMLESISPQGDVTVLLGAPEQAGDADGPGPNARFDQPLNIAADAAGNLYILDYGNALIRKRSADGNVTTLVGRLPPEAPNPLPGEAGPTSPFRSLDDIAVDPAGDNVYVASQDGGLLYRVSTAGEGSTLYTASDNAPPGYGASVAVLPSGDVLFVAHAWGPAILRVTPEGDASVFSDQLETRSLAVDADGRVFAATGDYRLVAIAPDGTVTTIAGVSGQEGHQDGTGAGARIGEVTDMTIDTDGTLYFTQRSFLTYTSLVRKLSPAGVVTTLLGDGKQAGVALGPLNGAGVNMAWGIAVIGHDLYITDTTENALLELSPRP